MLISDSHKFIFIHNQKVAGSSIARSLSKYGNPSYKATKFTEILKKLRLVKNHYPNPFPWHITAKQLQSEVGLDKFQSYYRFGFVRDPWDLQVSLYTFMLRLKQHNQHKLIKSMKNFDEYIDWRVNEDLRLQKNIFYSDNELLVDFIGKFEALSEDFGRICDHLNLDAKLPHINKSRENVDLGLYTKKTINVVYEAFYPDIVAFGYKKPVLKN